MVKRDDGKKDNMVLGGGLLPRPLVRVDEKEAQKAAEAQRDLRRDGSVARTSLPDGRGMRPEEQDD